MTLTVESWCEALESEKYEQATGQLRDGDNRFCCLGVACNLSGEGDWMGDEYYTEHSGRDGYSLPRPLQKSLRLTTSLGKFEFESLPSALKEEIRPFFAEDDDPPVDLSELNDKGIPFNIIAKIIRARPKGLFREDAA